MALRLGIPELGEGASLPRRLAWVTAVRLLVLIVALTLVAAFYLREAISMQAFTVQVALGTLGLSFALTGVYAALLRAGRHLQALAYAQLILDQLIWTVIVYLSGGVTSGATSFYGLSCVAAAILVGTRGAALAAVVAGISYVTLATLLSGGWLAPPRDQPPQVYQVSASELPFFVLVNLLALVVVTLLAGYLAERLRRTGGQLAVARERVEQAERMAALGRLAAGLAHEIRNPLSSIAGSVQLLKAAPSLGAEDRQLCAIVLREAARLNDLVTDMMDLARPRKPEPIAVNLAAIAREVVKLVSSVGRAATDVDVAYEGPERVLVSADPGQLRQLIWNLVRNAVQASSAGDVVWVRVSRDGAGKVEFSVADEGIGIDPASHDRLFDAFFTTRSKGTGVGLAVVKQIADEHAFSIEVESERGRGAVFRVLMAEVVSASDPGLEPSDTVASSIRSGPARVPPVPSE
jgi:signal transduction histidine kinase